MKGAQYIGLLHLYLLPSLATWSMSVPLVAIMTKRFPVWELFRIPLSQDEGEEQGGASCGKDSQHIEQVYGVQFFDGSIRHGHSLSSCFTDYGN
jgi:hypothetical protein